MGKGDRKSRRGKLFRGTYGKRRLHKVKKAAPPAKAPRPSEA
jgi:ribosomal small subunit protein bTHX